MITFEQCQTEILRRNPNSYYETDYIHQEPLYIPDVMFAISQTGQHFNNVLDIGPGWGTLMLWLVEIAKNVSVLDIISPGHWISHELLQEKNVKFYHESVFNISTTGPFDLITMTQVIPHLKYNPITAIHNISKIMNDDGIFITSILDRKYYNYSSIPSKFGKYWKALPKYGEIDEPVADLVTAMYDRYSLFELLSAGFDTVEISRCKSQVELLGVCSHPRRDII